MCDVHLHNNVWTVENLCWGNSRPLGCPMGNVHGDWRCCHSGSNLSGIVPSAAAGWDFEFLYFISFTKYTAAVQVNSMVWWNLSFCLFYFVSYSEYTATALCLVLSLHICWWGFSACVFCTLLWIEHTDTNWAGCYNGSNLLSIINAQLLMFIEALGWYTLSYWDVPHCSSWKGFPPDILNWKLVNN